MKTKLYLLTMSLCTDGTTQRCITLEEYDVINDVAKLVDERVLNLWEATDWLRDVNSNVSRGIGKLSGVAAPFKFGVEYKVNMEVYDGVGYLLEGNPDARED